MFRLIPRPACPACLQSEGQQTICEISYARLKAHMESAYVRDSIETHLPDILPHDYVIVECSRCFLLYQKYVPDSDSMKILYSEMISPDATFDRHKFHMDDLAYYERHFRDIFSVIAHLKRHPSQIRVLDFGSGWAQWARVAKAIGADVSIAEISDRQIENARGAVLEHLPVMRLLVREDDRRLVNRARRWRRRRRRILRARRKADSCGGRTENRSKNRTPCHVPPSAVNRLPERISRFSS